MSKLMFLTACLGAVIITIGTFSSSKSASNEFVTKWSEAFKKCPDLKAIKALPRVDLVYIQTFKSGEWVAVASEHTCCSGAGYNATVLYDSHHKIYYDTTHSFCGFEGLGGELRKVKATSLKTFYAQLHQLRLTETNNS